MTNLKSVLGKRLAPCFSRRFGGPSLGKTESRPLDTEEVFKNAHKRIHEILLGGVGMGKEPRVGRIEDGPGKLEAAV